MRTPEINAAPILWRVVMQGLGGNRTPCSSCPPLINGRNGVATLYRLTKRLAAVLSLPLTLHHSLAPRLQRRRMRDPETHKKDNVAPEVAFLSVAIIVLKMVYGLDGRRRCVDRDETRRMFGFDVDTGFLWTRKTRHVRCPFWKHTSNDSGDHQMGGSSLIRGRQCGSGVNRHGSTDGFAGRSRI